MPYRLGIIGGGNMGQAIARGAITNRVLRPHDLIVAEVEPLKRQEISRLGCAVSAKASDALDSEQVLLAVKPQSFPDLARLISPLSRSTIVVTIMAGLSTTRIRGYLGERARMIRVMPNTPCQLGEGMTGIALGAGAEPGDERLTRELFEALGRTTIVEESLINAVTAVSGSGPAYVYLLAELMVRAAEEIGISQPTAQLLVVQTIIGAGRMLRETGKDPEELRRVVTTPEGTTAAALDVMYQHGLPTTLVEALKAARDRGTELDAE